MPWHFGVQIRLNAKMSKIVTGIEIEIEIVSVNANVNRKMVNVIGS